MTQRYDTYKDSGVQWLGKIPGHRARYRWTVGRNNEVNV